VADVSEHDSVKEREGYDCKIGWISLFVFGHSVGLDDLLGGSIEIIALEIGRVFICGQTDQLSRRQFKFFLQ
jgi:hypothetical protein